MTSHEDVADFISASFRSVWALELMLYLKQHPGAHSRAEMIGALRASELVIRQALNGLIAGGLVIVDDQDKMSFVPASQPILALTDATEDLYSKRPDAVRRMIVRASSRRLTAFADAFRFKKS